MSEEVSAPTGIVDVAVLDDDLDFRNYIEDLLGDEGNYNVRTFAEPQELIASSETRVPDILLLDMKMGTTSGEEVIEQLLARWPELCIIIVTGYPSLESMRATFKLRVFDYLASRFRFLNCVKISLMLSSSSAWAEPLRIACASASATASNSCESSATGR
jgi:DNA-binding NtrC family response regulator